MNKKTIIFGSIGLGLFLIAGVVLMIIGLVLNQVPSNTTTPTPTLPENDITINEKPPVTMPAPEALTKPSVTVEFRDVSFDTFNYKISFTDEDGCGKITSFQVNEKYFDENPIFKTDNTGSLKEFEKSVDGLLANTIYVVKVNFKYDLADGLGMIEDSFSKEVTTLSYSEPSVLFEKELQYNEAKVKLVITDESKTLKVVDYFITFNDQEIDNDIILEDDFYIIKNLIGNNTYKFYIKYSYNLNDGKGDLEKTIKLEFTTPLKDYIPLPDETPEEQPSVDPSTIKLPSSGFYESEYSVTVLENDIFVSERFDTKGTILIIYYDSLDASSKNLLKMSASYAIKNPKENIKCYYIDINEIAGLPEVQSIDFIKRMEMLDKLKNNSKIYIDGQLIINGLKINATTTYAEFLEHIETYIYQE